jgi:hypothetical protein
VCLICGTIGTDLSFIIHGLTTFLARRVVINPDKVSWCSSFVHSVSFRQRTEEITSTSSSFSLGETTSIFESSGLYYVLPFNPVLD